MFHLDVGKVDRNAAHVAMVIHVCFECFICFSRRMFVSISSGCCICFYKCLRRMLQVFQLCFVCMLQVFLLDVSKVDLMLQQVFHMYIASVSSTFGRML